MEDRPIGIALPNHLMGIHFVRSVPSPLQGKADLKHFGISDEICELKGISNLRFKKLVKIKAEEFAFYSYLERDLSKLSNLYYTELKLQKY